MLNSVQNEQCTASKEGGQKCPPFYLEENMAKVTVKVNSNKQAILDEFRQQKKVALEAIGLQGETNAKMHITAVGAVDTGRLRNSITHATDEDSAYIGTNVEYAPYVEMGTYKMKARPYLEPAVTEHIDEYRELVENFMRKD